MKAGLEFGAVVGLDQVDQAARRVPIILHAEEVTCNVAMTCSYFGITPAYLLPLVPSLPA